MSAVKSGPLLAILEPQIMKKTTSFRYPIHLVFFPLYVKKSLMLEKSLSLDQSSKATPKKANKKPQPVP